MSHKKPVRLLMVATVERTLSSFLLPYAEHFRAQGWVVDGMASGISSSPKCLASFDQTWEMEWNRDPRSLKNISAMARVRQIVDECRYDLVHVHTPIASFMTRLALREARRRSGVKVVYTAHGFHCHPAGGRVANAVFCGLEKLAGRWTDALVVINHEDERLARRLSLAGKGRTYYMPGIGVDLDRFSRAKVSAQAVEKVREELGLAREGRLFLMVAALEPGKRHADAVRALQLSGLVDAHLVFAGAGPEAERIRALARRLGVGGRVHLLGARDDVPVLLAASTALVLPSAREGLPLSVLEAMAMKTPVIGTRIRGTSELLDGGAGILVGLGDVQALSEAMSRIVTRPAEAQAMAERAGGRVRRYALSEILRLHEHMYEELLHFR